jgi:hypothetical protein
MLARNRFHSFPSGRADRLAIGLLTVAAFCLAPEISFAGSPAFTDANWVSIPGAIGTQSPSVNATTMDTNGNLYAGGSFTNIGGVSANCIAEWNGVTWRSLGSGMNNEVRSLAFDLSGNLYAGGLFTTAGGSNANCIARWDGTNWSSLGSGMSGQSDRGALGVYALACDGSGNLYAGGNFTNAGGTTAWSIGKWNGSAWSALGSGMSSNGAVLALDCDSSGNLYAGGQFGYAGGVSAGHIAKWNGSAWSALGSGFLRGIYAVALDPAGSLYAGGQGDSPGLGTINLAKWNGANWTPLGTGVYSSINSLAFSSSNLYVGGYNTLAVWNGYTWSAFGSGIGGITFGNGPSVSGLAIDSSGNLYVGGSFTTAGTNAAANIAKALLVGPTPNQLTLAQPASPTNVITYLGTPGNNYTLDSATDLTPPINWIPQATNTASTNTATTAGYLTFTNLSTVPRAFYRVRSVP